MQTVQYDYLTLFSAFREANEAYAKVCRLDDTSDAALARNPDYRRLHRCGMTIARLGGGKAVSAAMQALDGGTNSIARYWAGMDQW
ncbi:MAG: hypothetical protein QM656_01260 [Paracoccaceae bacterium]